MLSAFRLTAAVLLTLGVIACGGDDDDGAPLTPGFGGFPGFGGEAGTGATSGTSGTAGMGGIPPADPFCGDGVVGDGEQCERRVGCAATERCTATCTCEAGPEHTPTSQGLIAAALAAGEIDYPTSLMYRVWALFQAPELPEAYDGSGSVGEDTYLFLELSRVRGTLPAEIETAIAPYLVRPDDPTSIWSEPPPAMLDPDVVAQQPEPASVACPLNDAGFPDWRAHETTNFVVWSCGGGVGGTDPLANGRVVTGTLAEQVLAALAPIGRIRDDDYAAGPGRQSRTDIYILQPNQCRLRNAFCTPIPNNVMAAAAPTKPCGSVNEGPLVSSAYIVIGANKIPSTAPAADAASELRYILAHEFFHAISFGLNFEAQGGSCRADSDPQLPGEEARSWLTEASAEWASYVYFADDDRPRRSELFRLYEQIRDPSQQGLHETAHTLPYEAFLYPLFVQEESNDSPDLVIQLWKGSQAARTRDDLDRRLNSLFPFVDHFRDFSVRNFNRDLPGSPIPEFHAGWDEALPLGDPAAFVPEPSPELLAPLEFGMPLRIAPLGSETLHLHLADEVRSFRADASAFANVGHVALDVLLKIGDSWRYERVQGPVLEFCRDQDNWDASELYLIVSNFDYTRAGRADGDLKITTRTACPGGWSGVMRVRQTFDEYLEIATQFETEVTVRHHVETQEWVILDSMPVTVTGIPVDRARAVFRGQADHFNETVATSEMCTNVYLVTETGSGSYPTTIDFSPGSAGMYSWTPTEFGPGFTAEAVTSFDGCTGSSVYSETHPHPAMWSSLLISPGLAILTEDPENPGVFQGTANPIHEEIPQTGGMSVLDIQVEWSLRRTPMP